MAAIADRVGAAGGTLPWNRHPSRGDPVRVVVADDVMLTREGIVRLLEEAGIEVVAQVGDAEAALREVRASDPDAMLMDIRMPPTHTDEGIVAA